MSSDPLLSRLRLRSSTGQPDPSYAELRDAKVVGFLFGSQINSTRYGRDLYQDLANVCRRHPHRFKLIYVSMDPDETDYKASTANRPWMSMIWNDGSSATEGGETVVAENDEDFIHSLRDDAEDEASSKTAPRPYSRIAMAEKFQVISVPHLAIYHVPSASVISDFVRPIEVRSDNQESSMAAWMEGKQSPNAAQLAGLGELIYRLRWTLAVAVFAIAYHLLRIFGGEQYDMSNILQAIFYPHKDEVTALEEASILSEL